MDIQEEKIGEEGYRRRARRGVRSGLVGAFNYLRRAKRSMYEEGKEEERGEEGRKGRGEKEGRKKSTKREKEENVSETSVSFGRSKSMAIDSVNRSV